MAGSAREVERVTDAMAAARLFGGMAPKQGDCAKAQSTDSLVLGTLEPSVCGTHSRHF